MKNNRFTAIKRLMSAASDLDGSTAAAEQQMERTRSRLLQGVDLDGRTFAPYKDKTRKHPNSRPLERAARLVDSPNYSIEKTLDGLQIKGTLTGQAAKIATYQNVKRRFFGFSEEDSEAAASSIMSALISAFNRREK